MRNKAFTIVVLVLSVSLALSLTDLYKVQQGNLIVYTTPALQSLLESLVVPRFRSETGMDVTLVYVSAGEEYNRVRMSGGHPEADVFLHASPLFVEKGFAPGYFLPFRITGNVSVPPNFQSRNMTGEHLWYAFAWSPLTEVYDPTLGAPPDLAFLNTTFGFPHPLLSNNGIYAVLFFENVSAAAGARALAHTVVQPVNARSNILGVADGAFHVTLGYEGVTLFYLKQAARNIVAFDLPILRGQRFLVPVIFSAGLVKGHPNPRALDFIDLLFRDEIQSNISRFYFRAVLPGFPDPAGGIPLPAPGSVVLNYDWSQWQTLESNLTKYLVGG
jgi:ABC-type molybdate transport system substrate-binding protein